MLDKRRYEAENITYHSCLLSNMKSHAGRESVQMHKDISSFDFENSQDFYINEVYGVIVIDMSGKIRYMNKQCMKLIGYTDPTYQQAKELFGRSVEGRLPVHTYARESRT